MIKPYNRALGARENRKQLPSAALPLWCLTAPPSRWEACHWILSRLSSPYESSSLAIPLTWAQWILSNVPQDSTGKWHADFPLRGKSPQGKRGAFPTGEGRLCCFPFAPWGGCEGFIIRGAFYILQAPSFLSIRMKRKWFIKKKHLYLLGASF